VYIEIELIMLLFDRRAGMRSSQSPMVTRCYLTR